MTSAYPLAWPKGVKRTPAAERRPARFGSRREAEYTNGWRELLKVSVVVAIGRLREEVGRLRDETGERARSLVVSTNAELRSDGTPRSDRRQPDDPGVAVYFYLAGKSYCLPCDKWDRVADNIAAIAGHIAATRAVDRYGVGTVQQAFEGFAYLPPPSWWTYLGLKERPHTLDEAEAAWRRTIKEHHPDRGGDVSIAARANQAIAEARKEMRA